MRRALAAVALALFLLHETYHLLEDILRWGPANPLGALYGVSDLGHAAHVVTGLIVLLALVWALGAALLSSRPQASIDYDDVDFAV